MIPGPSPLLDVRDLTVSFQVNQNKTEICSQVSFSIGQNERVGLIGESGCGKTIIALSILRLLVENAHLSGEILFDGINLAGCSDEALRAVRGNTISMIFEQPKTCLNPVYSIGRQIAESVRRTTGLTGDANRIKSEELLIAVGIDPSRYHLFAHQMSGGMQQRVMIAMAMASCPKLLIADEPTTALDLIYQAQILDLIKEKIRSSSASLLIITHDLDIAAELCDRVMVMYAGEIVEISDINTFLDKPVHPYSVALTNAVKGSELHPIRGSVPEFGNLPPGCRFHPRCHKAALVCSSATAPMKKIGSGFVRCHFA